MKKQYIPREVYASKLMSFINKSLIKVIVGQRRIGKSYLLFQIMDILERNFPEMPQIYINKEDLQFEFIANYQDLVKYAESKRSGEQKHALFIDEIQDIQQFERALRHFQTSDSWDIYCTGSNANLLSGELATYLSGRYIEIKMFTLSYPEFLVFQQLTDSYSSFNLYLKYGGMPYLSNLGLNDQASFEYLKNIYNTILIKDITSRYNIRNVPFLERLTRYIADNIGNLVSAKKISDYLKSQQLTISTNLVLDYLHYLENAFLIYCIPRNDLKGNRILEISEKYYFHDTGMRHAICSYKTNDIAQLFENVVLVHLLIHDYSVTVGKLGDKEVDFVCDKNGTRIYIQVTLTLADSSVRDREIGNLLEIKDNYRKIVVTGDEYTSESDQGVEIWNIRVFLCRFFEK